MQEIKEYVENTLLSYTSMCSEVEALEFELRRFAPNIHSESIRDMTFSHSGRERVSGSCRSDKTANMAIEHFDSQINGEYHALRTLISNMRFELNRVDHYLSLIPEKETSVIRQFYFERLTFQQISEGVSCVPRTLRRWKDQGVARLVRFYSILDDLDVNKLDIRAKIRFVSYLHEERFMECLKPCGNTRTPGTDALLYIISGCNELWNIGVENFYDYGKASAISYADVKEPITDDSRELLRLAYYLANSFERSYLLFVLRHYFPDLDLVHLELAVEALKLVLLPKKEKKG